MSTEKNNPQHSANIHASINGQQEFFLRISFLVSLPRSEWTQILLPT